MLSLRWKFGALLALLLAGSAWGQATYNCLPTCDPTDSRFLAIANGTGLITLSQPTLDLEVAVPKGTTTFTVGVFDGDAKGVDGTGVAHWDTGSAATFSYTLYADPNRDHAAAVVVPLSGSPSVLSTSMPDNAWIDFTVNADASAQSPSGNFFYLLKISLTTPSAVVSNAFKIRTGGAFVGGSSLFPTPEPFSYIANVASVADIQIVYPSYPSLTPTRYDGTFDFYFEQPVSQHDIAVWDGDFDHGKYDGTEADTDDPDTPNAPFRPSWATTDTVPEGVATGLSGSSGNPPDDRNPAGTGIYLLKPPSIRYDLLFPDGQTFANDNPSGNQEWEQFKISTDPFDRSQMDYHTDSGIPPGIYRLHIQGVDMQNLNALLLPGRALCVSQLGDPCSPLHPYLLGDTVFVDTNQNGVQDPGEPGIQGVEVDLFDENNVPVAQTHTDADGHYSFEVEAFPYTVRIAASNYGTNEQPGILFGYTPTTPEECQVTITNDNVLTCDFGYNRPGAIGDRVWNDFNGNGIQDPGEPGIFGVTVNLYDSGNNLIASDTTHADGSYSITNVPSGTYTVRIDDTSLPGGLTPTYDLDGVATPNQAVVTVSGGQIRTDVDFGYQGSSSIGDRVWNDVNGNGVQDPGEPGITGVTVQLYDDSSNLITTTVTGADGHYSFDHLVEATYNVQIDTGTLPAGSTETYDFDGIGTPDVVFSIFAEAGTTNTDIDFGYQTPVTATGSIGDRVWNDVNGDGVQDANEAGLNGVTVQLLDGANTLVATVTTSGDGNYTFSNLAAGTYTVQIVAASLPPGVAETYDLDGVGTQNAATLTLNTGENRTDVDFGYQGTASVGDRVWLDTNGNGVQDTGETGINGVQLQLLDAASNVLATTTTSGDGSYSFSRLNGGNYSVRVVTSSLPPGVTETYDLDGVITSDIAAFSLNPGDSRTDVDFGYRGTASVGDRVWLDSNGDGTQDTGETGVNGVTVQLLDAANNVLATATTTGDGNYAFSNLTAGNYSVRVTPPAGMAETYDLDGVATANIASFTLAAGQNRTDVDFGYRGTASVGDRVWLDSNGDGVQDAGEAGINGITVQLLDSSSNVVATATTSGDGNYTFSNLAAGNYSVRVVPPAGVAETYDLDGVATANIASFTLAAGQNRTDVDFGYRGTASIGDRVWLDSNGNGVEDAIEAGINGVTVQLLDGANNVVGTATTSGDGNYGFSNLSAGTYTVRVSNLPAGVTESFDLDGVASADQATFSLAAGQNRTDVDFGYRYNGSVGDRVWLDSNGNGLQDAGETGINGATVQLLDSSNNVVGTATTSGDGSYSFDNLAPGTYTVRVSNLPAGVTETFDLDGVASANQATFSLAAGQNRTDVDFGYRYNGSVGDRVWLDSNGNGAQDAGEAGINGVTVQLLDGSNNVVGTTTTSGDGGYTFDNLAPGTYTVRVSGLPAGVTETFDLDGVASANQATFSLAAGQNRTDVDFGYRPNGSVGDRVWFDGNGNGVQDAGEPGINGASVQLLDAGSNVIATTTTSGDGNYAFGGLGGGTYSVKIVASSLPAGVVETYDLDGVASANVATFSLAAGQNRTDVDFGYRTPPAAGEDCATASQGDPAYNQYPDGHSIYMPGIGTDFIFTPAPGTFTANADGTAHLQGTVRSLSNPNNGFTVDIQFSGYSSSPPPDSPKEELLANAYIQNGGPIDPSTWYYYTAYTGTLTGIGNYAGAVLDVTLTGPAFQVGVGANGKNTHFGASGWYNWTVVSQPASGDLLTTGKGDINIDLGDCPPATSSVGDRVWNDANGNGIQDAGEAGINGATVRLLDAYGTLITTTTTSGDGSYTFNGLIAGNYTVQVDASTLPAGLAPSYDLDGIGTPNAATFALGANANRTDVDFGYHGTASIGDRVWLDTNANGTQDAGETGINGATVQLLDSSNHVVATTTTSGDGNYTFGNLNAGTYTVQVVASSLPAGVSPSYDLDGIATANSAALTLNAGDNRTDVDFGYKNTGSVGDRVWLDTNANGAQDAGEAGINGVTVQLLDAGANVVATATTAGDGSYTFNNLAAGVYTVKIVAASLPAGVAASYDLDGIATANQATFTLAAGASRTDVDFGYRNTGSIGDRVWLDTNANGAQDAGEAGINGVTVQLLDSANNVVATTTTSGDGNYTFNNLAAGTYTVKIVASTLPLGVAETFDLDGVASANQATLTLAAGASSTDVDFGYRNSGSVGDRVWNDANGNGAQDVGEAGINGVTVQLLDSANNVVASTTTTGDGNYTFNNLAPGTYTVRIVTSTLPAGAVESYDLDGVASANQATFTLAAGQARADVDFGYRATASVGNRVWLDSNGNGTQDAGEVGINGVTVQLLDAGNNVVATAVTSGDGNYTFSNLAAGTYSVRVSTLPPGLTATYDLDGIVTPNVATFTLASGQNRTDVDFGYKVNGCAEGAPLDPVYGPSSGGQAFWFPGIVTDLVFTPDPGTFVANGDGTARLTGTLRSVSDPTKIFTVDVQFSGYTTVTPSGSPKKELKSSAYIENGGPINPATWAYYTTYTGTLTGAGAYAGAVITITRTGPAFQIGIGADSKNIGFGGSGWFLWTVTHQPTSGNSLQTTGQGDIDIDLDDCGTLGSVGNRVWLDANANGIQDSGETGINGVTVQLLNSGGTAFASAITSGDGNYTFNGVPAGTYMVNIVTSTLPAGVAETYDLDGVATANKATFTLAAGASRTDVDFGYRGNLSIGDRVWNDANGNGTQDSGEAGVNGVTVQLLNSGGTVIATATTSGNGNYTFSNLTAGTYTVKIVTSSLPAGSTETFDLDGLSSANQATVSLTASRTDVDFGYRAVGTLSIGDRVWKDANANGLQDSTETGVNGVTVQLLNSGGTVIATTTTSGNGNYSFGGLFAGTYTVKIVTSTLGGTFTETYDLDGLSSANQATVNLTASRTDVDFGYHFPIASCGGTGTLGYWKTHSSAWPVQSIVIGGVTYSKAQAITWLSTSVRGDETIALYHQLVPAELNALIGNNVSCITTIIQAADAWMSQHPVGSGVSPSSADGQVGAALESQLNDYNNGNLSCATHRN